MRPKLAASVLGLAMIVGCTADGIKNAERTNNSLSGVKTELTTDKAQLQTAVDTLNDLVYMPKTDLRPQYKAYAEAVDELEKSATASRRSARAMAANRETYLAKWRSDIAMTNDVDLRMRAQERIKETEKHFQVVSDKLNEADNDLGFLVGELKALKVYLNGDLTANGIKTVTDRATGVKNKAITANQKIDAAIVELDKVSDELAPMATTQPTTEPAM